jgi:hypothetical protein
VSQVFSIGENGHVEVLNHDGGCDAFWGSISILGVSLFCFHVWGIGDNVGMCFVMRGII